MQDNTDSPWNQPPLTIPLFVSRPMTRLQSQKALKGEVQGVTYKDMCSMAKELLEFSNLHCQKSGEHV